MDSPKTSWKPKKSKVEAVFTRDDDPKRMANWMIATMNRWRVAHTASGR